MRFGPVAVAEARGAVLAHSVAVPGGRLRKGRVLEAADIAALQAAGLAQVTVARLEPGDVDEDSAAARLARALVPDSAAAGLRIGQAATGRVNLFAQAPGVVQIDAARIHAVNAVHPMITVATVPQWQRLGQGGMAATVKIISYAVPEAALQAAIDAAGGLAGADAAMRLCPVVCAGADLIQTRVSADETGEKGHRVTAERLDRMGVTLGPVQVVDHAVGPLAQAIAASRADLVLILTGSATSDLFDVAPEALRAAGGTVTRFGMPVDPGNLLFFGEIQGRPVIGLPGCARAPAMNGADWVLERLLCGIAVGSEDIAAMGVGGLLKEIPARGRLRAP